MDRCCALAGYTPDRYPGSFASRTAAGENLENRLFAVLHTLLERG